MLWLRRRQRRRRSTTGRGRPGSAGSSWRARLRHSFIQSVGRSVIFSLHSDQKSRRSRHHHRAHHRHLPLTGGRPCGRAPEQRERPGRARTARPPRLAAAPDQWEVTLAHVIRPFLGLFVASRANQRAPREGGGTKAGGGWCEPGSRRPGSPQPRLCLPKERGAGLRHRAPRSRQRTRPARQTPGQVVCSIGRQEQPGRRIRSQELPRPLEQWGAGAAPGLGLGWNPRYARVAATRLAVELNIASAA